MKRNIFDQAAREDILSRIQKLNVESRGRWGRLSVQQMIRHLSEACRMSFDEVSIPDRSNFFTRSIGKWLFLSNIKPPGREKGKIKTFPEIDIVELQFPVEELENEKVHYTSLLKRLSETEKLSKKHPLFGKMSRDDWGLLAYAHADYHLTQFNA